MANYKLTDSQRKHIAPFLSPSSKSKKGRPRKDDYINAYGENNI